MLARRRREAMSYWRCVLMPRKSRVDDPGALRHIIVGGTERKAIFKHHKDYRDFLTRPGSIVGETQACCFARRRKQIGSSWAHG